MSEANPDDFGWPFLSKDSSEIDMDMTSERAPALMADAEQGKATIAAQTFGSDEGRRKAESALRMASKELGRVKLTKRLNPRSRAWAEHAKDSAILLSHDPTLATAHVWQTQVKRDTGQLVVTAAQLTDELAAKLKSAYGAPSVLVLIAPDPHVGLLSGRQNDESPFYGGAHIFTGGTGPGLDCTSGFAWSISSTTPGMLTAGHCAPNGASYVQSINGAQMGSITSGSRENWSSSAGTVYFSGQSTYRGDLGLIQIASGWTSSAYIYRGSSSSATNSYVAGKFSRRAQAGDQYCTGGAFSGEICGWSVKASGVNVTVTGGAILRNVVQANSKTGWCIRPGDSGGSVFITSGTSVVAKGITNAGGGGGSDYYGGSLDQCSHYFTDIWDAYYGLPGDIRQ